MKIISPRCKNGEGFFLLGSKEPTSMWSDQRGGRGGFEGSEPWGETQFWIQTVIISLWHLLLFATSNFAQSFPQPWENKKNEVSNKQYHLVGKQIIPFGYVVVVKPWKRMLLIPPKKIKREGRYTHRYRGQPNRDDASGPCHTPGAQPSSERPWKVMGCCCGGWTRRCRAGLGGGGASAAHYGALQRQAEKHTRELRRGTDQLTTLHAWGGRSQGGHGRWLITLMCYETNNSPPPGCRTTSHHARQVTEYGPKSSQRGGCTGQLPRKLFLGVEGNQNELLGMSTTFLCKNNAT